MAEEDKEAEEVEKAKRAKEAERKREFKLRRCGVAREIFFGGFKTLEY